MTVEPQPKACPATVTGPLDHARRLLLRRHLQWALLTCIALLVCGIALCDAANRLAPLRESGAFWILVAIAAAAALRLAVLAFRALFRGPSVQDVALAVERVHPEFLDSLICASEVERKPEASRRALERALLAKVLATTSDMHYHSAVLPEALRWRRLLPLAVLLGLAAAAMARTPGLLKALYHARDLVNGTSGIAVEAPAEPVPEHSDVRVAARIRRWEPDASIVVEQDGRRQRYVMNRHD
jgi:hypothetical protein